MHPFKLFRGPILLKPFNSTGAISLFKYFNDVSFEWALTHRSFPRVLPDSSNLPGAIIKFFLKFDVRMNYHQSNVFLQDLSNSFHRWLNLFAFDSPGVSKQFLMVFSSSFSDLKTEEEFLFNLAPFSSRFMVLASCHPLIIVFDCENSFHPSGAIQESFPFLSSEGHHVIIRHAQRVAIVLQILLVHHSNTL